MLQQALVTPMCYTTMCYTKVLHQIQCKKCVTPMYYTPMCYTPPKLYAMWPRTGSCATLPASLVSVACGMWYVHKPCRYKTSIWMCTLSVCTHDMCAHSCHDYVHIMYTFCVHYVVHYVATYVSYYSRSVMAQITGLWLFLTCCFSASLVLCSFEHGAHH